MNALFYSVIILPYLLIAESFELPLEEKGFIRYNIENSIVQSVERLSLDREILYRHSYEYNEDGKLCKEHLIGGLGEITYTEGADSTSPFGVEQVEFNEHGHVVSHRINDKIKTYEYTSNGNLAAPTSNSYYRYDCCGDLIQRDDIFFEYDDEHQLTRAFSKDLCVWYDYDACGRRLAKITNDEIETYLYIGSNVIGTRNGEGEITALRVPGLFLNDHNFRAQS